MSFATGSLLLFLTLTLQQSQGQNTPDVFFSVTEGYANTFVGDLKNTTYMKSRYTKEQLDDTNFNLLEATMFKVTDGIIRTAQTINREGLANCKLREECHIDLDVTFTGPGAVGGLKVSVEIVDINDYTPVFNPNITHVTFSEGSPTGSSRSLNLAVDLDSPQNGVKRYELSSPTQVPFKLVTEQSGDPVPQFTSLRLVLDGTLDREKKATYYFFIMAYDSVIGEDSGKRGTLDVVVHIEDDNDNEPQFTEASYELDISESTEPIQSLLTIKATDVDQGENGEVTYTWSSRTQNAFGELFNINEETGVVNLIGVLDYEEETEYKLEVIASDKGAEPQTATSDIVIHIIDENDNSPQITITVFGSDSTARLAESTPEGSLVAQVSVIDKDSGINGAIICTLPHPSFTLQSQSDIGYTFKVITAEPLDREVQEIYALHITCTDQGVGKNQETKTLVVTVTDENDNRPSLPRPKYVVNIYENNAIGDVLVHINATDKDVGANGELTYAVSKGEISKLISIDEKTGIVTANAVFDYESMKKFQFDVVIRDGGNPAHEITTNVTVHIKDRNDERPTFDRSDYTFTIQENNGTHIFVDTVSASDEDSAPFDTFRYDIAEGYEDVPFYIQAETGEIYASHSFDREAKDFYLFAVQVTDLNEPFFSTEANVLISILDQNDNRPRIVFPPVVNSTFTISNQLPVGTSVLTIQVSDADSGMNANCTYRMQEQTVDGKIAFEISPAGTIMTKMEFTDIETESFELIIFVQDRGNPPLSTSQKVTINVDHTVTEASTGKESKGNLSIIIAVTVVSIVIVAVLVTAILVIKLRERRRKNQRKEPYNIDRHDIVEDSHSPNDSQTEPGKTNAGYMVDTSVPISYNPLPPESKRSASPDTLTYEMKLDKVKVTKQLLATLTGTVDHDTSSSGSTDDSGRGASEEGGEYILRHSPFNDSADQVPTDTYALPQKKSALKSSLVHNNNNNNTTDSSKLQAATKLQTRIPPSYDTYLRRKASGRQKKVEFDLSQKDIQHYHSTGDLRSEMSDPESPSPNSRLPNEHFSGNRDDTRSPTPPPRPPKRQTYDDNGFVFVNHLKNKLEPVHSRSHSYQDLEPVHSRSHSYQDLVASKPPALDSNSGSSSSRSARHVDTTSNLKTDINDVTMSSIVV